MSGVHYQDLAVKYGTLDALTTELGNQAKKLEEDLGALKQAVLDAAEGWGGEAYDAFQAQSKEWDNHATAVHQALLSISQKVHQAGGDYRGGDLKGASYFQ
ncbi:MULTISPECIES: WXG100 family type VII secretion target [Streptomyces]|uniref:ESAT-6-like protein n=2 Tax=Streptomyces TaxID=1883 RepID=A0A5Q0LBM5_9ACTN|nr:MULTISPECIES: WXG100 family type VII secretion target [Streptomyces]MCX4577880.1 WXG100 family type VII secretion target [Streptomyces sp. NBC_01571]QFZ73909.1 WXG100 family type VII secretion target [Streptomyces fagopyri]QIY64927.1 WXG100 family type VII secretion target [Streptomyces sp. RPA4-2]TXS73528.1 WXG100 family type VII secretion target [Streptomyces sp. me109]